MDKLTQARGPISTINYTNAAGFNSSKVKQAQDIYSQCILSQWLLDTPSLSSQISIK